MLYLLYVVYHVKQSGWEFIGQTDVNELHYQVWLLSLSLPVLRIDPFPTRSL